MHKEIIQKLLPDAGMVINGPDPWDIQVGISCAGAFRARAIQVWQVVMTIQGTQQPVCRV